MKWTPQAIVAIMLGVFLLMLPTYRFVLGMIGQATHDSNVAQFWTDLMQIVAGGLLTYIGTVMRGSDK